MSKLISGKEVLIALANGEDVQGNIGSEWVDISVDQKLSIKSFITETNDYGGAVKFRLKPRTITINGIEVPAPFEPKDDDEKENSYVITLGGEKFHWRASSDYKQVVSALRSVFKPQ